MKVPSSNPANSKFYFLLFLGHVESHTCLFKEIPRLLFISEKRYFHHMAQICSALALEAMGGYIPEFFSSHEET